MQLETIDQTDARAMFLPRHYHSQLTIKTENLEMSIMFNPTVNLPELYISKDIPGLKLNLTPKEHPLENKTMFWLHECHL